MAPWKEKSRCPRKILSRQDSLWSRYRVHLIVYFLCMIVLIIAVPKDAIASESYITTLIGSIFPPLVIGLLIFILLAEVDSKGSKTCCVGLEPSAE